MFSLRFNNSQQARASSDTFPQIVASFKKGGGANLLFWSAIAQILWIAEFSPPPKTINMY